MHLTIKKYKYHDAYIFLSFFAYFIIRFNPSTFIRYNDAN